VEYDDRFSITCLLLDSRRSFRPEKRMKQPLSTNTSSLKQSEMNLSMSAKNEK